MFAPDVPEGRDADAEEHLRTAAMGRYQFQGGKLIASSHKFARVSLCSAVMNACQLAVKCVHVNPCIHCSFCLAFASGHGVSSSLI